MPNVKIVVQKGGKMTIEGQGFQGDACKEVLDKFLTGKQIESEELVAEAYQVPVSQQTGG